MRNAALYTAGGVFALVSVAQLTRYALGIEVVAGGVAVPLFLSLFAGIVAALLAGWMFVAARKG